MSQPDTSDQVLEIEISHPPPDHRATNPELVCAVVVRPKAPEQLNFSVNGVPVSRDRVQIEPGPGGAVASSKLELAQGANTIVVVARTAERVAQKVVECTRVERRTGQAVPPVSSLPGAEAAQILEQACEKNRLNSQVAILIAVLAIVMGLVKVYSENVGQDIEQSQAAIVDGWNRHQADRIRLELAEDRFSRLEESEEPARFAKSARDLTEIRQGAEKSMERAQEAERRYQELQRKDNWLDFCEASLSIAMALFAMTSLTQKRWLFWVSGLPVVAGLAAGLRGFFLG